MALWLLLWRRGRLLQAALRGACEIVHVKAGSFERAFQRTGSGYNLAGLVTGEQANQLADPTSVELSGGAFFVRAARQLLRRHLCASIVLEAERDATSCKRTVVGLFLLSIVFDQQHCLGRQRQSDDSRPFCLGDSYSINLFIFGSMVVSLVERSAKAR
ncbi:hypothetical protein Q2941_49740 [Bradyrhizobium sp. UFLA05-153]